MSKAHNPHTGWNGNKTVVGGDRVTPGVSGTHLPSNCSYAMESDTPTCRYACF